MAVVRDTMARLAVLQLDMVCARQLRGGRWHLPAAIGLPTQLRSLSGAIAMPSSATVAGKMLITTKLMTAGGKNGPRQAKKIIGTALA